MNPQFRFWWRWLLVVTIGVMLFGASFFILPAFMQQVYDVLLFSTSQAHTTFNEAASAYIRFIYVVLGAVMFGWGLSLLFTLAGPLKLGHLASWWAVVASVGSWFVIDSVLSVVLGFWQNAAINVGLFVLYAIALIAIRQHFQARDLQLVG